MLFTVFSLRNKEKGVVFHILLRTSVQGETCGKKYQYQNGSLLFTTNLSWKLLDEVPSDLLRKAI